ncbi:TlpA family protein disulfide reductase [Ilumatobacter sp.]|uniref:TlpA family protein disulfide reductase n=1 Tax=Ilumatobacter sp. TaxID=1967498 RepID=UPI0037519FB9
MKIARPRLLAGSLAVAALLVVALAVVAANGGDNELDAQLTDSREVIGFPDDGLANEDLEGDPLPLVTLGDRDGNDIDTASFLGQPLVVNFWFADCPPCAKELPDFAEAHAEFGDQVRFIGVNPRDSIEKMERFASERGVNYELYRDDFAEFTDAIGAVNFPITLFVTPEGRIIEQTGVIDADDLRTEINQLLEASA